eukprot:TRINITY_DN59223_c1_g1_i1.p1 TRINITY_DN59223_c1_g1~~TRINITY_DN59223_c1_g1_i1.p1  ORF type:complete len:125 (-),score=0.35 TRINITY_DN59223_c1_g1_i1:366-740(-)
MLSCTCSASNTCGRIEILNSTIQAEAGKPVGLTECLLFRKLGMDRPFTVTFKILGLIHNKQRIPHDWLAYDTAHFMKHNLSNGIQRLIGLSVGLGIPTVFSMPYILGAATRNVQAIQCVVDHPD